MNKIIFIIFISFNLTAQNTEIVIIDRFDSDKNKWSFRTSDDWDCNIQNGKLNMHLISNNFDFIWLLANGIEDIANKAYTEINYDFEIDETDNANSAAGIIFINEVNAKKFESVKLTLNPYSSYFTKSSDSYPNSFFNFGFTHPSKLPKFKNINSVKIILDNRLDADDSSRTKVYVNDDLVIDSDWHISNFNKIGFVIYGNQKVKYDNLIIKQNKETVYVEDAFDFISIDRQLKIDHNGIDEQSLIKYIPIELIDNKNILKTKELIKSLKKNDKCSRFETKTVVFNGKKRELFSFNYGNSIIDFFVDTNKPNPIQVNFLEKDDLETFFKIYSDYNSYRYTDENRSQWPSHPWFSILKDYDSYKATIWRGM